jgi:large subunit ribosomal protein L23
MYQVIKKPLITEKSAVLAEQAKTYLFEVDRRATKADIRKAVEKGFDVKVKSVRTMVTRGRWLKKHAKFGPPKYSKKAIVRLMPGETISIFEGA